jgi:hypothetical protein
MKQFTVTSNKMVASDPCYQLDTWCQAVIDNVRNGTWYAHVDTKDEGSWGNRISALVVYHVDCLKNIPNILSLYHQMPKLPFVGGVDSGQFGFFDHASYRNDDAITSDIPLWDYTIEDSGDKFYSACCKKTIDQPSWGILPFGAVSSSGFGDGSYDILGEKNAYGEYVAFAVIYIPDEDDDDDDDWDDDDIFDDDEDNDD